jgi:hypothetical protein
MSDMVEVNQRFNRCPKITGVLIPNLDDPLVGRQKLALLGRGLQVDQILDRQPHTLILLEQRTRVSEIEDANLASVRSKSKR